MPDGEEKDYSHITAVPMTEERIQKDKEALQQLARDFDELVKEGEARPIGPIKPKSKVQGSFEALTERNRIKSMAEGAEIEKKKKQPPPPESDQDQSS